MNGTAETSCGGDNPAPFERVSVFGGGAWGSALAIVSDTAGRRTQLWVREPDVVEQVRRNRMNRFLPQRSIPEAIEVVGDLAAAARQADLAILVIPSQFLRALAREVGKVLAPGVPVVICSKGIESGSGKLMTQVVAEEMPGRAQAVLSGPSFAEEVALGQPTAVTIATEDAGELDGRLPDNLAGRLAVTLGTRNFRPYLSDDPIGAEVGGAVKNVLAIACGMAAGHGLGSNPRAALITRGLAEIKRLSQALGGRRETVTGLSGIGDLTLTCSSEQSRNFSFGKALASGLTPAEALEGKSAVVEGAVNATAVTELARRLGVEMPICEAVDAILHRGLPIAAAIEQLLTRPIRAESRDLEPVLHLPHPEAEPATDTGAAA